MREFVEDWMRGKTAADFDCLEHAGGRLLWPIKLHRLRADKTWREEDAFLQTLDGLDRLEALRAAKQIFEERQMRHDDPANAEAWQEIMTYSYVALALREPKPNAAGIHPQRHALEHLLSARESGIARGEVHSLYSRLLLFETFEEPRLEELHPEEVVKLALAIAEVRNPSPLVATAGPALDTYVVSSAVLLRSYLLGEQSSPSPASSTPAASSQKNSRRSSKEKPT